MLCPAFGHITDQYRRLLGRHAMSHSVWWETGPEIQFDLLHSRDTGSGSITVCVCGGGVGDKDTGTEWNLVRGLGVKGR